ncbi:MAG: head GIN domain-containing protein [Chlamydiales bacterium]
MKRKISILFGLLLVCFYGCQKEKESVGSGALEVIERPVESFKRVTVKGANVNVYVKQGEVEALRIEAEGNLIDLFTTMVDNETLVIQQNPQSAIKSTKPINFYITMKTIESISLFGSGRLYSQGNLHVDRVKVNVSGSGDVEMDLTGQELVLKIIGSGEATLKGSVELQKVTIDGSGSYHATDFVTHDAYLSINGSGHAEVNVKDSLSAKIYGSGTLKYKGHPEINQTISASGIIESLEPTSKS